MAGDPHSLILYFLLIHFVLVCVYLGLFRNRHRQHFISELLIVLFLPITGFIFLIYSKWLRQHMKSFGIARDKQQHLDSLLERDKNIETISTQVKQSDNIVPLDDVLYLDNVTDKHKLLTTAIRQSALVDSSILKRAIRDKDRDVAHYAVSMATNSVSVMEKQVSHMETQWEKQKDNLNYLKGYAELLHSYIALGIVEEYTLEKLNVRYEEVLERILSLEDDEYFLEKLIDVLTARRRYEKAENILIAFNARHPEQEQGHLLLLKVYVMQKRHDEIAMLLEKLKQSKIYFSAEGMKLIRFWSSGVNNV